MNYTDLDVYDKDLESDEEENELNADLQASATLDDMTSEIFKNIVQWWLDNYKINKF